MGKAIKFDPDVEALFDTEDVTTPTVDGDIEKIFSIEPSKPQLSKVERVTAPFVRGVTEALDLPGKALAGGFNLGIAKPPGMPDLELPSGGFTMAAEELGLTVPEEQLPDTALSKGLQYAGESLTFSGPAGTIGKGITREAIEQAPKIKKFFMSTIKDIGETARKRPGRFFSVETGLGFTSGIGAFAAEKQFPDSPIAELVGTVLGGTLPKFTPTGIVLRKGEQYYRAFANFIKTDTKNIRQFGRLQKAAQDPEKAAELIRIRKELAETIPGLSKVLDPVDLTDDIGLFGVRAAILRRLPELKQLDPKKVEDINVALHKAFKILGGDKPLRQSINLTKESLEAHIQVVDDMMELYVKSATKRADDAVRAIPEGNVLEAERSFFEQLNLAEDASYKIVRGEWADVPNIPVNADSVMRIWMKELQSRSRYGADKTKIPSFITERFGRFVKDKKTKEMVFKKGTFKAEDLTVKDVQDARSEILQLIREERGLTGSKDKNKIRYLTDLQKSLLKVLENVGEGLEGEAAFNFKRAIAATKLHNEKFNRGIVAKILGVDSQGLNRVDPDIAIGTVLSGKQGKAAVNLKQIEAALDKVETRVLEGEVAETLFEGPEQAKGYISDWVAAKFTEAHIDGGEVDVQGAIKFIQQNERVLERLPLLKRQLENVVATGNTAAFRKTRLNNFRKRIQDPKVALSALIINKDPMVVFREISKSRNPETMIDDIIKQINKADKSGEGIEGLRHSFIEFLRREASVGQQVDQQGHKILSGFTLTNILDGVDENEGLKIIFEKLLTKKQQDRINVIADFARSLDERRGVPSVLDQLIGDNTGKDAEFAVRVFGARLGSTINSMVSKIPFLGGGGGALQVPGYTAQRALEVLREFTNDPAGDLIVKAIMEDEDLLFKALTTKIKSKKDVVFVSEQMNAYLITAFTETEGYLGGDSGLDPSKVAELPIHYID